MPRKRRADVVARALVDHPLIRLVIALGSRSKRVRLLGNEGKTARLDPCARSLVDSHLLAHVHLDGSTEARDEGVEGVP
jgi:hypothetical protein